MSRLDRVLLHAVEREGGCWEWGAYKSAAGYGRLTIDGSPGLYAHRVAYEELIGSIPEGLQLDHLCRNRACINPWHLEPVTPVVNTRRGEGHGSETHCPQKHPYSGANLYIHVDKTGQRRRMCRTCNRQRAAAWRRQSTREDVA